MRAGRKRKAGYREPNGQLRRPTTQQQLNDLNERAAREAKNVVLLQPHRVGSKDPESAENASALGRLWLELQFDRIMLQAGKDYAGLVRRWRAVWGMKDAAVAGDGASTGQGPSEATVRAWRVQIDRIEEKLDAVGGCNVRFAINRLVIDDRDLTSRHAIGDAQIGLRIIARELGLCRPDHPFHG